MAYTCQNCGATSYSPGSLCNPTNDEVESKFCGTSADQVCEEKTSMMKYSCEDCGSLSADAEHLCSPNRLS
jgi:uncharacterized OB-fold protein